MRRGTCVTAMSIVAVFLVCCVCVFAGPARADDDEETRAILFSGRDIWRNGVFSHSGLLFAPGGIDNDGLLLKLMISGGVYRYSSDFVFGRTVIGVETAAQVLPGWRIKRGDLELKFFFGLEFQKHRLWPDDASNILNGGTFGLRMAIDLWYQPTPNTMLAFDGSISSIATSHAARAAVGELVFDDQMYFGPEIAFFASTGYRHFRLGAHFTAMKTGSNVEWVAAGGWAQDSDRRSSPYVRLGLVKRM